MQKKVIECKVREKSMKKKITIAVVILVIIAIGAAKIGRASCRERVSY